MPGEKARLGDRHDLDPTGPTQRSRAIARCHIAAWRRSYRPLLADEILSRPSLEDDYETKWSGRLRQPPNLIFLAEDDVQKLLGFVLAGPERTGRSDYQGEIYLAYLLEEYRGQGIGRKLFQRLAGAWLENQVASAIVWVFEENPCRHCYAAWGAEPVATCPIKVGQQDKTGLHQRIGCQANENLFICGL